MKYRHLFATLVLGVFVFSSGIAFSYDNVTPVTPSARQDVTAQREIDEARAPIKSAADLQQYLANEQASSPLNKLTPQGKAKFLASLRFGDKALGGYNYQALENELTASEIYDVLSLFGAQATTHLLTGATVETQTDALIMRPQVVKLPCGVGQCGSEDGAGG
ncbi:MAG TPA: hypothetical protein VN838_27670, partial [Bradyrhizobium sp.]|nr:hypothetical protein [Bradyrhizobium sp.]